MKRLTKLLSIFILGFFMVYGKVGFRLELRGGYGALPREDLNLRAEVDEAVYAKGLYYLYSFPEKELTINGEFPRLKKLFPLEGEAFFTFGKIGLSLGFDYFYEKVHGNPQFSLQYQDPDSGAGGETAYNYDTISTSITGLFPNIKLHLLLPGFVKFSSIPLDLDFYAGMGVVFGKFTHNFSGSINMNYQVPGIQKFTQIYQLQSTEEGKGKGWGFTAGASLNYNITGHLGFSLGARYLYAKAKDFTGTFQYSYHSTRENIFLGRTYKSESEGSYEYEGKWIVYKRSDWWENYTLDTYKPDVEKTHDLEVDFSGAQFFLGIFLRF